MIKKTALAALSLLLLSLLSGCCLSHEWVEADCVTPRTCAKCGKTEGEALGHQWQEATCTDPGTCSRCGETRGEALGHDVRQEIVETDIFMCTQTVQETCSRCGTVLSTETKQLDSLHQDGYFLFSPEEYSERIERIIQGELGDLLQVECSMFDEPTPHFYTSVMYNEDEVAGLGFCYDLEQGMCPDKDARNISVLLGTLGGSLEENVLICSYMILAADPSATETDIFGLMIDLMSVSQEPGAYGQTSAELNGLNYILSTPDESGKSAFLVIVPNEKNS